MRTRTNSVTKAPITDDIITQCLAKAVADGDIVNFRFLFIAYSPLREDSTEDIHSARYAYLRPSPEEQQSPAYRTALAEVSKPHILQHVRQQLAKKGPAQLPAEPLILLADNAVRLGKYTSAAQTYELLRIRRRMQDLFLEKGIEHLEQRHFREAARGLRIAAALDYDYAAFPEALPRVPNYQRQALILHAEYPKRPEDSVALQPPDMHFNTALSYLLLHKEIAGRLTSYPLETRLELILELVKLVDPHWDAFAARYKEACALVEAWRRHLSERNVTLEEDDLDDDLRDAGEDEFDPVEIPACLLGRRLEGGEWWQYLKELAYEHPPSVLFLARQAVSKEREILVPRILSGNPLPARLGLWANEPAATADGTFD